MSGLKIQLKFRKKSLRFHYFRTINGFLYVNRAGFIDMKQAVGLENFIF